MTNDDPLTEAEARELTDRITDGLGDTYTGIPQARLDAARHRLNAIQRDRHSRWRGDMKALNLESAGHRYTGIRVGRRKVQGRTIRAAHGFTLRLVEEFGHLGGHIFPSTRTIMGRLELSEESVTKYLRIAVACEWLDVVQEGWPSGHSQYRRPGHYQIREWVRKGPRQEWKPSAETVAQWDAFDTAVEVASRKPGFVAQLHSRMGHRASRPAWTG
jgi:hypothetical protein